MNEYRHNSSEAIQRTQPGWFHPRRYYLNMLRKLIEYAIEKHIPTRNGILVDYGCDTMQGHIHLFDKVTKQHTKNTDAFTFLIVASAKKLT